MESNSQVQRSLQDAVAQVGVWQEDLHSEERSVYASRVNAFLMKALGALHGETMSVVSYLAKEMEGDDKTRILGALEEFSAAAFARILAAGQLCVLLPMAEQTARETFFPLLVRRLEDAGSFWRGVLEMSMDDGIRLIPGSLH